MTNGKSDETVLVPSPEKEGTETDPQEKKRRKKDFFRGVLTCAGVLTGVGTLAVTLAVYLIAAHPRQAKENIGRWIDKIAIALPIADPSKIEPTPRSMDRSLSLTELQELARSITVRVLSGQSSGSGIVIEKQDNFYTVLTNGHVVNRDEQHKIKTPDNDMHEAKLLFQLDGDESGEDLAVLQFSSTKSYDTVPLDLSELQTSEQVLAAGFPFEREELVFMTGKTTVMLDRALKGGYQIAYLINIQKGMSGGPLLNSQGALVGVNGKHQPLWKAPYRYQDGDEVGEEEYKEEELDRYSWAIPIQTFLQYVPPVLLRNINFINDPKAIERETSRKVAYNNLEAKISYDKQGDKLVQVQLTLNNSDKGIKQNEVLKLLSQKQAVKIQEIDLQVIDLDNDGEPEVIVDIIAEDDDRYSLSWIYRLIPEKKEYEGEKHFWGPVDDRPSYQVQVEDLKYKEGEKTILLQSFNRKFVPDLAETDREGVFPLQLWKYSQGELTDVTREYPDIVKKHTQLMFREYVVRRDRGLDLKNVLAAYLADKYLLGEGEEGWRLVETAYQKEEDSYEYFENLRSAIENEGYDIK